MQNQRKKILWLVSWYPNKYDPFDGDFIQRHARAAALYDDIHVLFVKQEEAQKGVEQTRHEAGGLTEQIIYLPKKRGPLGSLLNFLRWKQVFLKETALFIRKQHPQTLHVHVPWKAGLVAVWIKKRHNLPFFVIEHWGIYNQVVDDNIHQRSFLFRWLLKNIFKEAKALVSVSRFLGEGIQQTVLKKGYTVIPNVVDTALFYPGEQKASPFTFLHVSNMVPLKNVTGILRAFQQFLDGSGANAQLVLVGNRNDRYVHMAGEMGLLNKAIFFKGEIPYSEVASYMQRAHVFVLNSNIENSPCVIGEAHCCGLPVVATHVGGIPELVTAENGLLIPPGNDKALAEAMMDVYKNYSRFKPQLIADCAHRTYAAGAVGLQFHQLL